MGASIELADLNLLRAVVRAGGFAAASRRLDVDPSTVSRRVAQLEHALGFRVFQRSTRRLALTEAGAVFLERIGGPLEEIDAARAASVDLAAGHAGAPRGTVRLTASVAFAELMLAPLLSAFRSTYPQLLLELLATDARLDLVAERVDLAVRLGPQIAGDLIVSRLRPVRYRLVASPEWRRSDAGQALASPEDLIGLDCLRLDIEGHRECWRFKDAVGCESLVAVSGALLFSSPLTLRRASLAGLGPALLADWMVERDIDAGRLIDLLPLHEAGGPSFESAAWLAYPPGTYLPAKTRAAANFLRDRLGRRR